MPVSVGGYDSVCLHIIGFVECACASLCVRQLDNSKWRLGMFGNLSQVVCICQSDPGRA